MLDAADPRAGAQALAEIVRREWPKVVATLTRITGDLELAEDAAQDAAEQALTAWKAALPDKPTAWIMAVARRRAVDRIRREANGRRKTELLARLESWDRMVIADPADEIFGTDSSVRDDQLRLIFGCCHPALSSTSQMALTLRSVGGLTTEEIAAAFLTNRTAMAQRLSRAKRKIATAAIPFALPRDAELPNRREVVRDVLYLIFNQGYAADHGEELIRKDLCGEAIRLTRLLVELVPDDPETLGLASLMLSTNARSSARIGPERTATLLEDQDRSLWDQAAIAEAEAMLDRAARLERPGPRQVQAAIGMEHVNARTPEETDWNQIGRLYSALLRHENTPVVRLNHAVAVAMADGAQAGLALLDDPTMAVALDDYRYYHSARADLLNRVGRTGEAKAAYQRAIELAGSDPEVSLLKRKAASVGAEG